MSRQIAAFAKLTALEGKRDELIEMLKVNFPRILEEEGTQVFAWHRDKRDKDALWAYELYEDRDALFTHGEWAQHSLKRIAPLLAKEPEIAYTAPLYGKGIPE